eukprot:3179537-Amphidinium_carterae.1
MFCGYAAYMNSSEQKSGNHMTQKRKSWAGQGKPGGWCSHSYNNKPGLDMWTASLAARLEAQADGGSSPQSDVSHVRCFAHTCCKTSTL